MQVGQTYIIRVLTPAGQLAQAKVGNVFQHVNGMRVRFDGIDPAGVNANGIPLLRFRRFTELATGNPVQVFPRFQIDFVPDGQQLPHWQPPAGPEMVFIPNDPADSPEWDVGEAYRALDGPLVPPANVEEGVWYTVDRGLGARWCLVKGVRQGQVMTLDGFEAGDRGSQQRRVLFNPIPAGTRIFRYPRPGAGGGRRRRRRHAKKTRRGHGKRNHGKSRRRCV